MEDWLNKTKKSVRNMTSVECVTVTVFIETYCIDVLGSQAV